MKLSGSVVVLVISTLASLALLAGAGLIHLKSGAQREGLRCPAAATFPLDAERHVEMTFRALRTGEYDVVLALDSPAMAAAFEAGGVWPEVDFSLEPAGDAPAAPRPKRPGSQESSKVLGTVVTKGGDAYRLKADVRPTASAGSGEIRLEVGKAARERIERDTDEDLHLVTVLSFVGAIALAATLTVWIGGAWRTSRRA